MRKNGKPTQAKKCSWSKWMWVVGSQLYHLFTSSHIQRTQSHHIACKAHSLRFHHMLYAFTSLNITQRKAVSVALCRVTFVSHGIQCAHQVYKRHKTPPNSLLSFVPNIGVLSTHNVSARIRTRRTHSARAHDLLHQLLQLVWFAHTSRQRRLAVCYSHYYFEHHRYRMFCRSSQPFVAPIIFGLNIVCWLVFISASAQIIRLKWRIQVYRRFDKFAIKCFGRVWNNDVWTIKNFNLELMNLSDGQVVNKSAWD